MSWKSISIPLFLLVSILLIFFGSASAVSNGRCESYTGAICSSIYSSTSTMVYINDPTSTQQDIETQMRQYFGAFASAERDQCAPYLLSLLCSQFLPTCTYDINNNAIPRFPCSQFCPDDYGLLTQPESADKSTETSTTAPQYGAPNQCSGTNAFFFTHSDKAHFRPVCWGSQLRQTNSTHSYPIDQEAPSPIQTYRDLIESQNGDATLIGTGKTLSDSEKAIVAANDQKCDPLYHTYVLQANTISTIARTKTEHSTLLIEFPTHECPLLLTAIPALEYTTDESPCAVPCPNLTFTNAQYKKQDVLVIVFNSLSIICLFILCLSWTVFPALRLQNYVFYYIICISAMTLSLFILIPIARAQHKTIAESLCETPTKEYHMKGYALVQGMVTCFAYMSATAWGLIMVLDIFIQVVIGKHMQKQSREYILKERLYHIFSWFWGVYSVVGGLASQQIGATVSVGGSYALIIPSRFQQESGMFNAGNPFFYYPLLVLTFISVFLMFAVLFRLLWFRSQAKTTGLRLATFVRLFIFIVANTFIICVFLVYSIDVNAERDNLELATTEYVQCLYRTATFDPTANLLEVCGAAPDHRLNFNILLLTVVLFNGMGVIAFLIYGTTTDLVFSWLGTLYVVFGFETFKKYEKDYRRNRKSTKMATTKTSQHPAGEKSRTSRGSNLLTSHHHHNDSQTHHPRSHLDAHSHVTDDRQQSLRAPSQDPKSRQDSSQPRKTVFNYNNQKTQMQQKRRATSTTGVGLDTTSTTQSGPPQIEMMKVDEYE